MSFRIEHRLGINAPAPVIWDVLKDIEQWPQWTDLYPEVSGTLRIGGAVTLTEQIPGGAPQQLKATIIDWVPDAQIHWKSSSSRGWIKRTRYIEIEQLSENGCIFSNGEIYSGFLSRYVDRNRKRAIRIGFAAFGEALREQVMSGMGAGQVAEL
jgi:hypothetical protein